MVTFDGSIMALHGVRYVLKLRINLILFRTLGASGYMIRLNKKTIKVTRSARTLMSGSIKDVLSILDGYIVFKILSIGIFKFNYISQRLHLGLENLSFIELSKIGFSTNGQGKKFIVVR